MVKPRLSISTVALLCLALSSAHAEVPDYKLGDVAKEDVITPVSLVVLNPAATETLKQKISQQSPVVVRQIVNASDEAEADLRDAMKSARTTFNAALERSLNGRPATAADLETPDYAGTVREVARELPKDFPLTQLAPLWVRGQSDGAFVERLLQPVREVMTQAIATAKTDATFPPNRPIRLVPVKTLAVAPTLSEIEAANGTLTAGKVITLWRARRLVETSFLGDQASLGRFAAVFVRTNVIPDPTLTDLLQSKRLEGVAVNETYEAAQVILRKGQSVDGHALGILAVLREKSLIGTLQTKLERDQSVAGVINQQTKWIVIALAAIGAGLALVLWRLRSRPSTALALSPSGLTLEETRAGNLPLGSGAEDWRRRAIEAEGKAQRAQAAIRSGAMGWMREKLFRTLVTHRQELLSGQQTAEKEMRELEDRLEQLHAPLQERLAAYERRIDELEKELAAKGETNRELISARITLAKQKLSAERDRRNFEAN